MIHAQKNLTQIFFDPHFFLTHFFFNMSSTIGNIPSPSFSLANFIRSLMQSTTSRLTFRTAVKESSASCSLSEKLHQALELFCGDFNCFSILKGGDIFLCFLKKRTYFINPCDSDFCANAVNAPTVWISNIPDFLRDSFSTQIRWRCKFVGTNSYIGSALNVVLLKFGPTMIQTLINHSYSCIPHGPISSYLCFYSENLVSILVHNSLPKCPIRDPILYFQFPDRFRLITSIIVQIFQCDRVSVNQIKVVFQPAHLTRVPWLAQLTKSCNLMNKLFFLRYPECPVKVS